MATFGIIISNRSFFPDHLVATARKDLLGALDKWGHKAVILSTEDTYLGQVMTTGEAEKCAALFRAHTAELDGIIVCLPNFGEEAGIADCLRMANLDLPILIQACDDDFGKLQLENRRDAFCGKLSLCNNLYYMGIRFTLTSRHTCKIDSEEFKRDVTRFAGVCNVVKALRGARIAAIGARPKPFRTVRFSERLLQRSGITVEVEDFSEIIAAAQRVQNGPEVDAKIEEIRAYGKIKDGITDDKLKRQAKLCIVLENWVKKNGCSASAVQCWDSVATNYGCAACLAMSMMGSKGLPSACEMDVMGAVSMLALQAASGKTPIYQDWNNNYGNEADKCINVHCSNYPAAVFEETPEIGTLDILGTVLGEEVSFGALKGRVKTGGMTYLKIATDDVAGKIKCYLGEGSFTEDPLPTFGGVAVCQVKNLNALMKHVCENGYEHHVALVHAEVAGVLAEALQKYMGFDVYLHS
jgi:L-fucose isomerase-like protein